MKKCLNGHEVSDNVKFCPKCGADIVERGAKFCAKCGNERKGMEMFCSQCGTPFDRINTENNKVLREVQNSPIIKYLLYFIGGIILLGTVVFFSIRGITNSGQSPVALANDSASINYIDLDTINSIVLDNQSAKEKITKRLEEIFDDVVKGRAQDCDERFFSSDFKRIYKEVEDIDERYNQGGVGFWDSGFWDMSQDNIGMSIVVNDVYDIKDNEAIANVTFSIKYYGGTTEPHNEDIKVILEDGKWVLDDLHGYKKQMKEYIEGIKKTSPAPIESSTNISPTRTFTSEQMVVGYLANQTFRSSDGFTIRFDGSGRMYAEGDFAGVVSVLHYNSTSAMLRYGGGQYTEGQIRVDIVGDKFQLTDPVDGTVYYQR